MVYSYPVDLTDYWGSDEELIEKGRKYPSSMRIVIQTPWVETMAKAELDINKENLIFKYPETYYLDIELMYEVDPDAGKAKYLKDKKVLEITLPITGLTEKTKMKIKAERAGYDAEVKSRLEKAGIMDISDYKSEVTSGFIPDEAEGEAEADEQSEGNEFLKFVKDGPSESLTEENTTLTDVKFKYDEAQPQEDSHPKVTEIGDIVDQPKGETVIAPQATQVEQSIDHPQATFAQHGS